MSAGISDISDADLLRMLGPSSAPEPASPSMPSAMAPPASPLSIRVQPNNAPRQPAGGPATVQDLSDDELMQHLGMAKPASFDDRFGDGAMARDGRAPKAAQVGDGNPVKGAPSSIWSDQPAADKLHDTLQGQADERLVGAPSAGSAVLIGGLRALNSAGMNLPRNAVAGVASLAGKAGVPGFNPSFGENYSLAKDQEDSLSRLNHKSAIAGDVVGIGAGMVALPAWGGAASLAGRMGQAAATGVGYGAASEFADTKDVGRAAVAGAIGGAFGAGAQPIAEYAIRGAQVVAPMLKKGIAIWNENGGLTYDAVNALLRAGIDPKKASPQLEEAINTTFGKKGISDATAREAGAGEFGIPLSRGQATQEPRFVQAERSLAEGDRGRAAQDKTGQFFDRQRGAVDEARQNIGTQLAGGENRVMSPHEAGEMVAGRAREISDQAGAWEQRALHEANSALEGVRPPTGSDVTDAGATVARGVRDRAAEAKGAYRKAYDDVAAIPGEFAPGALDRLGSRVRSRLPADVPVDEVLTPAATRALADLDNLPALFKTGEGAGPDLQAVDQLRKRIVAYRGSTAQNPTDRRAIDRILHEFDGHVEDAMGAGLFGPRAASRPPAEDFPGNAVLVSLKAAGGAHAGQERPPETLRQFLGKEGGIALDGDARAADLQRVQTGYGPLARNGGRSLDDLRPRLIDEGFLPPDRDGGVARNIGDEVHELIRREVAGEPVYRIQDQDRGAAVASSRAGGADDHFADLVHRESQRITADHEAVGLRARDLDPDALRTASESLVRGEHSDPFSAYEAAVMNGPARKATGPMPDVPFDGPTAVSTSTSLPGGDTAAAEAMKKARAAFSEYQRTFKPQGSGDDVGRAVQRIVERDAQPGEVASMLYGGSRVGNTGLSVRLAGRLKSTLGEDSAEWIAVQQGLIAKTLGTDASPQAMAERVRYLLDGEGRTLAKAVLSPEQVAGLERFRTGVKLAGKARDAVPSWVSDVAKGNFEPSRVAEDLFNRATTGARAGTIQLAEGVKKTLGEASPEWAAMRQALWQRISTKTETGEGFGPRDLAQRINALVDGPGKTLAKTFYSEAEMAMMKRFAGQVQLAVPPAAAKGLSKDQTLAQALKARLPGLALNGILGALGYAAGGEHGAAGFVATNMARKGIGSALAMRQAKALARGAPSVTPPPPNLKPLGIASGLGAAEAY